MGSLMEVLRVRERVLSSTNGSSGGAVLILHGEPSDGSRRCASMPVPENDDCHDDGRPIPVLVMNGTEDPIDPYGA
jgi:hypothetical protein